MTTCNAPLRDGVRARLRIACTVPLIAALAACGGGGNESGQKDVIQLSMDDIIATGPPGACATGTGPTVYIYGGTPPYTLTNSAKGFVTLDVYFVRDSGDGFTPTFNGACIESLPVTVQDDMGRLATVRLTNVKGT